MPRGAGQREVGEQLADDARKLEAVARKARGDRDLRMRGVEAEQEVGVGRHRVQAGPETGAVIPGALESARVHGLSVETLTPSEAEARWPAFRVPPGFRVVHEPQGGYLFVEECVRAHADEAVAHGAEIRSGVTIHGWRTVGGDVEVDTDAGRFAAAGELKTKPSQHSVGILRQIGIQPDVLVCRTERALDVSDREKIALFCNVPLECVIEERDKDFSIYEVPLSLQSNKIDEIVLRRFGR